MFNKNTYLIPPSSLHPHLPDINGVEILLHHHHPDAFSGHYFATTTSPIVEPTFFPQDHNNGGGLNPPRKQTVKKDRHSKIYTSQGPRDRRVRLSIGIARKFFDLQEMLGFDKPSKTLDWLLTKSKAAIKELVQSRGSGGGSSSECEMMCSDNCCKKKSCGKEKGGASNLAKESRAKARARARERTREKMSIRSNINANCNSSNGVSKVDHEFLHSHPLTSSNHDQAANEDLIHESIVIKRRTKNPSIFGFNHTTPSVNDNWDVCSFTSQSNMYAIWDQHKFINSNSNI